MKYIILFFIIITKTYSQNEVLKVTYDKVFNTSRTIERTTYLYVQDQYSLYQENFENNLTENNNDKLKEATIVSSYTPDISSINYKFNSSNNTYEYITLLSPSEYVLIYDTVKLNWELTNEKKVISGYECIKAKLKFRGVNWVAWFTTELPYAHGPWKFHGLPGLIMEISDEYNKYNFHAQKIEFVETDILQKSLAEIHNKSVSKTMSLQNYQEFLDEKREAIETESKGRGIERRVMQRNRGGMELIYEWEEEERK